MKFEFRASAAYWLLLIVCADLPRACDGRQLRDLRYYGEPPWASLRPAAPLPVLEQKDVFVIDPPTSKEQRQAVEDFVKNQGKDLGKDVFVIDPPTSEEQRQAVEDFVKNQGKDLGKGIDNINKTLAIPSAWKDMGLRVNQMDDWFAFFVAVCTNGAVLLGCVCFFSTVRSRYRLVYQKNVWDNWGYSPQDERSQIKDGVQQFETDRWKTWAITNEYGGQLPERLQGSFFDWIKGSLNLDTDEIQSCAGLDQAMLVEFLNMGVKVFTIIGVPMVFIMAPLHIFFGGNRAGVDYLSWQGFANVEQGSPLCWVHAGLVWYVVLVVDRTIYEFQEKFVARRAAWLESQPHLQACTILVENIPLRCRSCYYLRNYFNKMFGDREVVEDVNILISTPLLKKYLEVRDSAHQALAKARSYEIHRENTPRTIATRISQMVVRPIQDLELKYAAAQAEVVAERFRLTKMISRVESMCIAETEEANYKNRAANIIDRAMTEANIADRAKTEANISDRTEAEKKPGMVELKDSDTDLSDEPPTEDRGNLREQAREAAASQIQTAWRQKTSLVGISPSNMADQISNMELIKRFSTFSIYQDSPVEREIQKTYSTTGFVTFKARHDAIMALRLVPYTPDREELMVSEAPDPVDVDYVSLTNHRLHGKVWYLVGVTMICGLFIVFLPTIALISSVSNLDSLAKHSDWIKQLAQENPKFTAFWNGLAGAMGLNVVLSFLPTVLVLISQLCFLQKANTWSQHSLQKLYFAFLIVFQLLVVSISYSLVGTVTGFVRNPLSMFERLSIGMGQTTHFFMSIFVLQWATIGMEHTRYIQLIKYVLWKKIVATPQDAVECSEPEDQDYYGIGARSARYTAHFVVGLAFVSLCPLICVLAWINFVIIRIVVGYQVVYAETKKPDLGGVFWVTSLKHCHFGLLIFTSCMAGVLAERADSPYPSMIVVASSLYAIESMYKFDGKFFWQSLSHEQIVEAQRLSEKGEARNVRHCSRNTYKQPELIVPEVNMESIRRQTTILSTDSGTRKDTR